jgi:hypothetical protein
MVNLRLQTCEVFETSQVWYRRVPVRSANVEPLRADILAVQEVEPLDNVLVFGAP